MDALVETGRSDRFLEEQLGPILGPSRPPSGYLCLRRSKALFDFAVQRGRDARRLGVQAPKHLLLAGTTARPSWRP